MYIGILCAQFTYTAAIVVNKKIPAEIGHLYVCIETKDDIEHNNIGTWSFFRYDKIKTKSIR